MPKPPADFCVGRTAADNRVVSAAGLPLNAVNGRAEGFEIMLQRRSGNRFSGWLSYGWFRTRLRENTTGLRYPTDFDQSHTARRLK